ncbi:hypothetical protein ACFRCG_12455 [Embleya sp. NPDC056575]|uniref:hypothetical protein n=1 Tax=unclassified Embleya TaxID=2699296 RepID=UPI0036C67907
MRALWHRAWWTEATPEEVARIWEATSHWAAVGSTYATTTLRHLRGRIRQYTGLEPDLPAPNPHPDRVPITALVPNPTHPPHGTTAWWRCTAHDPTTDTRLAPESREPATAWEHPEDITARVHGDLEHIHRLRPEVLRRAIITAALEAGSTTHHPTHQLRTQGTDINHIRRRAALRRAQEQHATRRATLLRHDLDPTWHSRATPTEITALKREIHTWPPGPPRNDILAFLQHHL